MANFRQPFFVKQGLTVQGGDTRLESAGSVKIPLGSTAERPVTGEFGMMRGNSDTGGLEDYFQNQWWDLDHKVKWIIRSADTTIANGMTSYGIAMDTSAGPLTVSLPTSPKKDDYVIIADGTGFFATNNVTIDPGSARISGVLGAYVLKYKNQSITLSWSGNTSVGWVVTATNFDMTQFSNESEESAFVFALIL